MRYALLLLAAACAGCVATGQHQACYGLKLPLVIVGPCLAADADDALNLELSKQTGRLECSMEKLQKSIKDWKP